MREYLYYEYNCGGCFRYNGSVIPGCGSNMTGWLISSVLPNAGWAFPFRQLQQFKRNNNSCDNEVGG